MSVGAAAAGWFELCKQSLKLYCRWNSYHFPCCEMNVGGFDELHRKDLTFDKLLWVAHSSHTVEQQY